MKQPEFPAEVSIVEMGARDGLQNQSTSLSVRDRADFIDLLSNTGLSRIEMGSFVSSKAVPQMAGTAEVFQQIKQQKNIIYSALTPNLRGFDAALLVDVDEVAVFAAASETFSQKNINCSIAESLRRFEPVLEAAKENNIRVRGYVSCVLGCPYEGSVSVRDVAAVARELHQLGCYEISLGDTIGIGTPFSAKQMLEAVRKHVSINNLAAHFHNTYGQALVNLYAVIEEGLAVVDSSVAGLGGCPYAPGASGNVATEDVVYMLEGMDIKTGVNMENLLKAATFICGRLEIPLNSCVGQALSSGKTSNLV